MHSSSLSEFHAKSKIEAIVNGKPTKNITNDHIRAIKDKLRTMKLIWFDVEESFFFILFIFL